MAKRRLNISRYIQIKQEDFKQLEKANINKYITDSEIKGRAKLLHKSIYNLDGIVLKS